MTGQERRERVARALASRRWDPEPFEALGSVICAEYLKDADAVLAVLDEPQGEPDSDLRPLIIASIHDAICGVPDCGMDVERLAANAVLAVVQPLLDALAAEVERLRSERNIAVNTAVARTPNFDVVSVRIQCEQREAADRRALAAEAALERVRAALSTPPVSEWARRYWRKHDGLIPMLAVTIEDDRQQIRRALDGDAAPEEPDRG